MMNICTLCATTLLLLPVSAHAEELGQDEIISLDVCLLENSINPWACHRVAYYTCMGGRLESLNINPTREQCLGQELLAWKDVIMDTCLDRAKIDEDPEKYKKDVCLEGKSPWGDDIPITKDLEWKYGYDDPNHEKMAIEARSLIVTHMMISMEYQRKRAEKNQ